MHRRNPFVAVVSSILCPGLGQIYCGNLQHGLAFLGLSFLHWLVFIATWVLAHSGFGLAMYSTLGTYTLVWLLALAHAWNLAKNTSDFKPKSYHLWYFYVLVAILAWALQLGLFQVMGTYWLVQQPLQSDGMTPSLMTGDRLRIDLRQASVAELKRGLVVALQDPYDPETTRILRIVGLPGEEIKLSDEGITISGQSLMRQSDQPGSYLRQEASGNWTNQRYAHFIETMDAKQVPIAEHPDRTKRRQGVWKIPNDHVFVLGDNRMHAVDSTAFGPIPISTIRGRVFQIWFSKDPKTGSFRPQRRGLAVK